MLTVKYIQKRAFKVSLCKQKYNIIEAVFNFIQEYAAAQVMCCSSGRVLRIVISIFVSALDSSA